MAPPALTLSPNGRRRLLFAFLCVVWGCTWLAMKVGVTSVPPAFFSGVRWTMAGLVLLAWRRARGHGFRIPSRMGGRLVLVAMLMISLNATIQLYGLRLVGSGLAAVISAGLTPLSLLAFSVAAKQERFDRHHLGAIILGVVGILLLFGPKALAGRLDATELLGAAGIVFGTLSYSAGSVLARPLMRSMSPAEVAASTNLIGGLVLLVVSLFVEPGAWAAASGDWGIAAWLAWLYLVGLGSLGATIVYFLLVRDWGASRTGSYAFVSPVIAVLLGVAVLHERIDAIEVIGMVLMLTAAGIVLRRKQAG